MTPACQPLFIVNCFAKKQTTNNKQKEKAQNPKPKNALFATVDPSVAFSDNLLTQP